MRDRLGHFMKGQIPQNKNKKWSEEIKKKIGKNRKGKTAGSNHPLFGKHHTKEAKEKMRLAHTGKKLSETHRKKLSEVRKGHRPYYWKGGRIQDRQGYVWLFKPTYPSANKQGYVSEHRFVIEQYIGRLLLSTEEGHHINKIKNDNRPKNLMAFISKPAHHRFHRNPTLIKHFEIIFDGRKL